MGDSDEDQERKCRDRDKFKRERECSDKDLSDSKRKHASASTNITEGFRQKPDNSQFIRASKRLKRSSQDIQNVPYLWQPFEVPTHENLKQEVQITSGDSNVGVFLMSFKQFMMEQDDSIDEVESVNKYNLYKQNISAQFISSYFEEHKAQQWFQEKYHPYISNQICVQKNVSLLQRFVSFWFLYENSLFDNISLDIEKFPTVESVLDISVLLMDYNIIMDKSLNISDLHRKILEKLRVLDTNDIKPDTTTSTLSVEDGELNEHFVTEKLFSLQDYMLPEGSNPFFTSTVSIGGLPLSIQKERLETVCKPFGNVIRIFLTDPTVHSTGYRNCTLTFSDAIDNNALVSNLQSNFPKEDFPQISICVETNRIQKCKPSAGIFSALDVVLSNLSLAVKIVQTLDSKRRLFVNDPWFRDQSIIYPNISQLKVFSSLEHNPLLQCVPSEEEIVLIRSNLAAAERAEEEEEGVIPSEVSFRRSLNLVKVLDHLILYLRIVHSFDFYVVTFIDFEDLMPSRLGQITVRGSTNNSATVKEVQQHIADFSASMNTFLVQSLPLTQDEMLSLGRRIEDECVEKFIQENTKMIEVEKYLCPLSGKKFKGPEYVRKHIHNKHRDKIDEVKLEVEYFNCYLSDRNRPMPKMKNSVNSTFQKNTDKQNDNILNLMGSQVFRTKDGAPSHWPFNPNILLPPHGPPFHHSIDYTRFPSYSNFGTKRNQNRKIDDNRKPISYKDWDDPNLDN